MAKKRIPSISDERLMKLRQRIKPVEKFDRSKKTPKAGLYYLEPVDLRRQTFSWNPEPTVPANNLEEIAQITTYHTYGYAGFFKPSEAEVLAQIPSRILRKTVAYRVGDDFNIADGQHHRVTTILYGHKQDKKE